MLEAGMPLNLQDYKGNSLLMLSAYHGYADTTRMLLARGADPDLRNDRGQTPLAGVAFKGHADIAELLLQRGADANASGGAGLTPLHFARIFGRAEVARILQSHQQAHSPKARPKLAATLLTPLLRATVELARLFRR